MLAASTASPAVWLEGGSCGGCGCRGEEWILEGESQGPGGHAGVGQRGQGVLVRSSTGAIMSCKERLAMSERERERERESEGQKGDGERDRR